MALMWNWPLPASPAPGGGQGALTEKPRVARSPPRNTKKCKKTLESKHLAAHRRVHVVSRGLESISAKAKAMKMCGVGLTHTKKPCTAAPELELIIPN